jgi:uncharacterized protein YndB with AHSA1/START domain
MGRRFHHPDAYPGGASIYAWTAMNSGACPGLVRTSKRIEEREMTNSARGGDRILGSLRAEDDGAVRMQDRLEAPIDDVWSALTEPGRLAHWLGEVEGELRLGGEFSAHFLASGWRGTGRIEACEPPRRLLVLTRDADEPDSEYHHAIEVTLSAEGDATAILWEERGMPVDLLAPYGAGIQVHVEDLASYLAGGDRCDASARFEALLPAYQALAVG